MKTRLFLLFLLLLTGCIPASDPTPETIPASLPKLPSPTPTLDLPAGDITDLINSVMTRLNNGQELTSIINEIDDQQTKTLQVHPIDFNGDGIDELFFAGTVQKSEYGWDGSWGVFWIASSSPNGYQVVYVLAPNMFLFQGDIRYIGDVNGDGLPDLVVGAGGYGNFCNENLFIFGWQNKEYVNYQAYVELCVTAFEVGENHEMNITGGQGGALGGGPPRKMVVVLTFQEGHYQPTRVTLLPSEVRIHVLEDAQIAFDAGDYALALEYWDRAAHDPTLENYPSQYIEGQDQPEIYQPAYALYRMYALYLFLGEEQNAENIFREIATTYPQGSPGSEFIGISTKTAELFEESHDPGYVCPELVLYIDGNMPSTLTDHWVWGFYNYDIVNFCPLPQK